MKTIKKFKDLKMNNERQRIYEDEVCSVVATGHNYDFIFYIKNKTENDLKFVFEDDPKNDIYSDEDTYTIGANNWLGFESNYINWNLLENLFKNKFEIMEA